MKTEQCIRNNDSIAACYYTKDMIAEALGIDEADVSDDTMCVVQDILVEYLEPFLDILKDQDLV